MTLADFFPAIREAPDDPAPRLICADWLEEAGDVERAEYVRLACRLEPMMGKFISLPTEVPWGHSKSTPLQDLRLLRDRHRLTELLQAHETAWLKDSPLLWTGWQANSTWVPSFDWDWRMGFVHTVRCTLADWYGDMCGTCMGHGNKGTLAFPIPCDQCNSTGKVGGHGPEVVRTQPVLRVELTDFGQHVNAFEDGTRAISSSRHAGQRLPEDLWKYCLPPGVYHDTFRGTSEDVRKVLSDGLVEWAVQSANFQPETEGVVDGPG